MTAFRTFRKQRLSYIIVLLIAISIILFFFYLKRPIPNDLDYDPEQQGLNEIITIRFSHVVAENTPKGQAARFFAQRVFELSHGRMHVEVFPNGTLYSDVSELDALKHGNVDMIAPSSSNWSDLYITWKLLDLPFIFYDHDDLNKVLHSEIGDILKREPEKDGLRVLTFWHSGFKQMTTRIHPLVDPEDFKGLTFRTLNSETIAQTFHTLGASTIFAPFNQTYFLLEKGEVDSEENTLTNIVSKKFYLLQPYMTLSYHGYLGYPVLVSNHFWEILSPQDQTIILQALEEAGTIQTERIGMLEQKALNIMKESGVHIHIQTPEERLAWKKAVLPVYEDVQKNLPNPLKTFIKTRLSDILPLH
ncbi:MAG: DctP family TRAP transporter solute-binding subunit [Candidatus Carbobacillus sp.]|nr:DctP family TRAP transporter solute-binding subunit [Candidatus Carbobacillus sp.]